MLFGGAESQDRTGDTAIFSRVLYQLSYLGPMANQVGRLSATGRIPRPSEALQGDAADIGPALGTVRRASVEALQRARLG